jgi:hypothetical protein
VRLAAQELLVAELKNMGAAGRKQLVEVGDYSYIHNVSVPEGRQSLPIITRRETFLAHQYQ